MGEVFNWAWTPVYKFGSHFSFSFLKKDVIVIYVLKSETNWGFGLCFTPKHVLYKCEIQYATTKSLQWRILCAVMKKFYFVTKAMLYNGETLCQRNEVPITFLERMVSPCPMCNRWFPLKDWYQYLFKSRQTVITLFWISFLQYNIWTRKLHSGICNN